MRIVICHYHLYKNSGTSFDAILTDNYGRKHLCFDGPFPFFSISQTELTKIIERKSDIVAFSSHQVRLPVPTSLDFLVLPVVFIRHPILRVLSIYKFKKQADDGTITSHNARKYDFNEWVLNCLNDNQEITHISNAQTRLLSSTYDNNPLIRRKAKMMEYDLNQAIRNIEVVPLLARTESFDKDVGRFGEILSKYDIEFVFNKSRPLNSTSSDIKDPLQQRIVRVSEMLSENCYSMLLEANEQDLCLFERSGKLIESSSSVIRD